MAARAYWQGQIRLALVSIPVEIYPATKSGAAISFKQIHEPTGKPIITRRSSPASARSTRTRS
jgi:DNA end-binding protein Ku